MATDTKGQSTLLDVAPTAAFIQSSPVYSLAATKGMSVVFMGGEDGFVRKYDFEATMNGSSLLPSTQRHMLPDSVTKSGVLSAFWENEQLKFQSEYDVLADGTYTPQVSPVYSLACEPECLWVAAGLESGDISIQSATYGELGQVLAYLRGHTKTVSDLKLTPSARSLLSGSWDKSAVCWDLETGIAKVKYNNLSSQVSSVDWQAANAHPVEVVKEEEEDEDKSLFGSDSDENEGKKEEKENADEAEKIDPENEENKNEIDEEEKDTAEKNAGKAKAATEAEVLSGDSPIFLTSTFNGKIDIWDTRQKERASTLLGSHAPPWCLSAVFSVDGNSIYAGRRNSCVELYDVRSLSQPQRTLKFPAISGSVTCVTPMPDNRRLLCACYDNIRLFDLESTRKTPFTIVPGHHGTAISRMLVDAEGQFIVSATGGRGWIDTVATESALAYEAGYE